MVNERKDIRTLAMKYDKLQTLMCYVNKETLMEQHKKQMKGKASGIDGVTKEQYNENAENNIENLLNRMKKFSYKPQAVKRVYIPKTGSDKLRPYRKLIGMYAYYGINGMFKDLLGLYKYVKYGLYKIMCRRSQKKINVKKYKLILERIPIAKPKIYVQIW